MKSIMIKSKFTSAYVKLDIVWQALDDTFIDLCETLMNTHSLMTEMLK